MIILWPSGFLAGDARGGGEGGIPRGGMTGPDRARRQVVLVVDDDEAVTAMVTELLQLEGYTVATAANGREALERMREQRPVLVLLDMRMPVMDGWEFTAAVREARMDVPIVVMTAAGNAERWADSIKADAFVAKPFEIDDLLAAVARHKREPGERRH